jgi:hypothetical protein
MTRWMGLTATNARIGVCLGIALLIGCSDSDSTSGLNLEKSTVEEPGVTSQIEEVRPDIQTVISPSEGEEWGPGTTSKFSQEEVSSENQIQTQTSGSSGTESGSFERIPTSLGVSKGPVGGFAPPSACFTVGSITNKRYVDEAPHKVLYRCDSNGTLWSYVGQYRSTATLTQWALSHCWNFYFSTTTIIDVDNAQCGSKPDTSSIKVTTPNGGQKWKAGKSYRLRWSHTNSSRPKHAKVKIQLLKSGKHYKWISTSPLFNDGEHGWKIPFTVTTGSAYTIKITSVDDTTVTDTSDSNFTITKTNSDNSKLTVTTPNGGQKWKTGKSYTLKWTHKTAGAKVKIQLLKAGKARGGWISKSTKNDGKHVWKIPSTVATGSAYTIKITSTSKKTVTDTSNKNFTITKSAGGGTSLKISTPNGGQNYKTGQKMAIRWVKGNGGTHVKIVLLKGGKAHKTIANKTKNDGQHTYTIPATIKTAKTYKIKVSSTKNAKISDTSNKNFTITKRASIDDDDDDDDGDDDGGGDDNDDDDGGDDGR